MLSGGYQKHLGTASGVYVFLRKPWDSNVIAEEFEWIKKDKQGRYTFKSLESGRYELYVRARSGGGTQGLTREIELRPGTHHEINLGGEMGPYKLEGRTVYADKVIPWKQVLLKPLFDWDYTRLAAVSDPEGHYVFHGLREGSYECSTTSFRAILPEEFKIKITGDKHLDIDQAPPPKQPPVKGDTPIS